MKEKIVPIKILFILFVVISTLTVKVYAYDAAPNFTLTDIDGNEFSLSDYQGKVVLLDFFYIDCPPCREEMPHLKTLHEEFGEDLVIISIDVNPYDTVEDLQVFKEEQGIGWTIARDTAGVSDEYNVQFVPTLVLIDPEGYIRYRHVGFTHESVLSEEITEIPEFPVAIVLPLFMIVTLVAVVLTRVIRSRKQS